MSATIDFTTFHNIVAGRPRTAPTSYSGTSPITRAKLWDAPVATQQDVDDAVVAAQAAFPGWAATPYAERTRLLGEFADLYLRHAESFVELLMEETGRSRQTAAIEVYWAANWLRYPAQFEIPQKKYEDDEQVIITKYEPLGVVAAICPWNFPLMLAIGKIAPAIATGNCVIVKPSPFTPYTALKLIELAQQVFPPSTMQVLGGDATLGPALVRHPSIQKISFTGSTATGKEVMRGCVETMKRVTLEMAGSNPSLILPDIDIATTAAQIAGGLWFNAGQVCINARRLYIHASIYEEFVAALADTTSAMSRDLEGSVGPVQNAMQFEKIGQALRECRERGYKFAAGGDTHDGNGGGDEDNDGLWIRPVVLDNPPDGAGILVEEVFGPIIPCKPFHTVDEAITLANGTASGLSAIVWTKDAILAEKIASRLEVGNVFINGAPKPNPAVPFGGHKQSGMGVEYGLEGLLSFCQIKAVHMYK
ncbi:aldehyde dehydrogenase [Aspergillus heteromorphus CBS 117.55]|uniref:aldehyde dehydrogenase (NAD(+)) n=1 Tax=Aspergillus heteromorphus CBS 117.55 TaxID=1448321 RepID=A0A317VZC5_9EURO|nr:aldehyde dehydrogenase [Aspergillus heteromorphus CBS 117.55]PWY79694.1 aldehyde dehydrogenase [Aspergillus heteromorphus CBS 117.55]